MYTEPKGTLKSYWTIPKFAKANGKYFVSSENLSMEMNHQTESYIRREQIPSTMPKGCYCDRAEFDFSSPPYPNQSSETLLYKIKNKYEREIEKLSIELVALRRNQKQQSEDIANLHKRNNLMHKNGSSLLLKYTLEYDQQIKAIHNIRYLIEKIKNEYIYGMRQLGEKHEQQQIAPIMQETLIQHMVSSICDMDIALNEKLFSMSHNYENICRYQFPGDVNKLINQSEFDLSEQLENVCMDGIIYCIPEQEEIDELTEVAKKMNKNRKFWKKLFSPFLVIRKLFVCHKN